MKTSLRALELELALPVLLLAVMGTLTVYSAGVGTPQAHLWIKQSLWNVLGIAAAGYLAGMDHRRLFRNSLPIYVVGVLSLGVVLVAGKTVAGSKSWLALGGVTLQPSEFVKWMTLLFVAHRLGSKAPDQIPGWELAGVAGLICFPMLLVLRQPDLGVALTFTPLFLFVPLVKGIKWRWVLLGLLGCVALSGLAWQYKLHPYQKERILTFLDPSRDLKGKGYQVHQSRIAIGSGGLLGQGFMSGSQTQLNFLPVKTTDFVFSVWAEERGYLGVLMVLGLFGVFIKRILDIAKEAKSAAGAYFCAGAAGIFGLHILINVGMVSGAVPTTGIPLPFFTYGGSSTLAFFLALGVILNIRYLSKVR
ncbi:MAG: rod shape-determining protein RodA [Acidobacteria bacterium]|nr:rod shape-determining protein RodA [Acidobacteriota bacterium]